MLAALREKLGWSGLRLPSIVDALLGLAALFTLHRSLEYTDDAVCLLINAGLFCLPFLLAIAVGGRLRAAAAVASALGLLVWGIGETKLQFFGERLGLSDFYFLSGGANWGIVKRYPEMQRTIAAWVALTGALSVLAWRAERGRPALGLAGRGLSVLLLLGWCGASWAERTHHAWEVWREDADCGPDKTCGVMSRLVYSYTAFEFVPPSAGAETVPFQRASAALTPAAQPAVATRPDVLVWLHESTFNPAQYRLRNANLPTFSMFERGPWTRADGLLRVHTYGGRTWMSEFSVLTGLVPSDFGARSTLVFNSVAPQVSSTLVNRFKAAGYDTIALMPTSPGFYGAGRTYEAVGFDRIMTLRDFPEYQGLPGDEWDISDSSRMAAAATKLLEAHRQRGDRPLFVYLLSIKEHGPYSAKAKVAYGLDNAGVTPTLAARLSDYVNRLGELDRATKELERALTASARPTLWTYFGDHQAYFGEAQPGYRHDDLPDPDLITQYQLRANYDLPMRENLPLLDIALLPSLIADNAGLPADAYFKAQSAMRRLCAGRLRDCPESALVTSYKGYIYDPALGLFGPKPEAGPKRAER